MNELMNMSFLFGCYLFGKYSKCSEFVLFRIAGIYYIILYMRIFNDFKICFV